MMFFMHLKFEGNWKFVLLTPTTILAIGLPLALLPDIGASYYTSVAPQTGVWASEIKEFREHHAAEDAAASVAEEVPAKE
jgi:cytochrome c oxidase subunit 4